MTTQTQTWIGTPEELNRVLTGSIIVFQVMGDIHTYKTAAWVFVWRWPGKLIEVETDQEYELNWLVDHYGPGQVVWAP